MEQTEYQKFYLQCKLECPCGGVYSRYNLSKHKKTKKHLFWINNVAGGGLTQEQYNEQRRLLSLRKVLE